MKLLTNELLKRFEQIGCQDGHSDPLILAHFFNPVGAGDWYASEYYPENRVFFGFVSLLEQEWGYFSLDELESVRLPIGLKIERELYFNEIRFSELAAQKNFRNMLK